MGTEILAVPEEKLPQVIAIIRRGIATTPTAERDAAVCELLMDWCLDEEEYWDRQQAHEEKP